MTRLRLTIVLAISLLGAIAGADQVRWSKSYETAIAEAKRSNRLVMLFFYADWCTWCQRMNATTFVNPRSVGMTRRVVPARLNVDEEGKPMREELNVKMFPAVVFLTPDGEKFGELYGYVNPTLFADELGKFDQAFREYPSLKKAYDRNPKDGTVNAQLAAYYGIRRDEKNALKHLQAARRANYKGPLLSRSLNMIGDHYQLSERFDIAIKYFNDAFNSTKDAHDRSYSMVSIMSCYYQKGDRKNGDAAAKKLIAMPGATREYVEFAKERLRSSGAKAQNIIP